MPLATVSVDALGMVVSVMLFDVVSVPIETPVANDAETETVFLPSLLCVTVFDFVREQQTFKQR